MYGKEIANSRRPLFLASSDIHRALTTGWLAERGTMPVTVYVDDGVSGTKTERPELNCLVRDAVAKHFDVVVVSYMSRLGRGDAYTIIENDLRRLKVRVELVKEKFTNDTTGYMAKKMQNLLDGAYPVMVRDWTLTKMEDMFHQGFFVGGAVPFGCKTGICGRSHHKQKRENAARSAV